MTSPPNTLSERLAQVEERVRAACERAGRERAEVRLIAVSKRKPAEDIRAAYALGQRDFGENYMQELLQKQEQLQDLPGLRFHMIGHLQRNKARHLVSAVRAEQELVLHTLDDARLISELSKRLAAREGVKPMPVFVEVNIASEAQKSGCLPEQLPALIEALDAAPELAPQGLMVIPPAAEDPELTRPHFAALRELRDSLCPGWPRLSMGMSQDFELAIEEGATDVRVGTAIFGVREAK